nr:homeobox protein knotted-1-like 2 [Ziziphus jujuba var. spinosa]
MISVHPLFGMLIQMHINCLKLGLGKLEYQVGITSSPHQHSNANLLEAATIIPNSSDLDKFMEAYCIEKPVKETTSFIKDMYAELKTLCVPSNADEPLVLSDK